MKGKSSVILRIALSTGLVGLLIWGMRKQLPQVAQTLAKTNPAVLLLAVLVFAITVCVASLRLKFLFDGENLYISLWRVTQLSFIGYFFNNFMPTAVGGDVVKVYYAYKQTNETTKSFIAVFMDRFIGVFSFILMAVCALLAAWQDISLALKKIIFFFLLLGVVILVVILNTAVAKLMLRLFSKFKLWNVGNKLSKVYMAVHEYRNRKFLIFLTILVSLVGQSIYFFVIYLLAMALGVNLSVSAIFVLMPIVSVISMLPSLGGLGLREGAMVALFGPVMGGDNAFSLSILLLATLLVTSIVGAVIYMTAFQFKIKPDELSELGRYSV